MKVTFEKWSGKEKISFIGFLLIVILAFSPFVIVPINMKTEVLTLNQNTDKVIDKCKKKEKIETCLILANEIADDDSLVKIYLEY